MSIFFKAYAESDFFGKLIFILLFLLSVASWTVLIRKIRLIKNVRRKGEESLSMVHHTSLKTLLFQREEVDRSNPFAKILQAIASKTSQIINKNHHFKDQKETFLSQRDMQVIDEYSAITIFQEVKNLTHDLFILSTVVSLAPFLGILGTVWGILISLGELQKGAAGSNTIVLGGLSTALATTVLGLVIAIPALIAYNYLKNAVSHIGSDMEGFSHSVLSQVELQYREVRV